MNTATRTAPIRFDANRQGPLAGIRVVDLSRLVAGNMASLQLGDMGADVIKVEPPEGDPLRAWKDRGLSLFWKAYARNKRSIALNLRAEQGREALLRLLDGSDVLIENYRPGTLEKMGLAPQRLLERNPRLIILRISGFGQSGPYSPLPGFGTLIEAMSGLAHRTGFADREPVLPPLAMADMITGLYGCGAVATALLAREQGRAAGQVIDLSLLESMYSILGPEAAIFAKTGTVKQRVGSASNTTAPRNVYRTRDGKYVALSGSTQSMALRLFELIGQAALKDDPRFNSNSARVANRAALDTLIAAWFAERDRTEALALVREAGVTVGPVYSADDMAEDPHFIERGVFVEVEDEELGSLPMHGPTARLSSTPGVWRRPAPRFAQHSDEILREIGFSAEQVTELRACGAVL